MKTLLALALVLVPGIALAAAPGQPGWYPGPVAPYHGPPPTLMPLPPPLPDFKPACLAPTDDGGYALVFVAHHTLYTVPMPEVVRPGFILVYQGKNLERCD